MTYRLRIIAVAGLVAVALVGCSSSKKSPSTNPTSGGGSSGGPTIVIKNFAFSGDLSVKSGAKVTVKNEDSVAHTVTANDKSLFDTGSIDGGGSGSFTAPSKPGSYPFGCTFHSNMHGTLTVS
jgi:plastocyanin